MPGTLRVSNMAEKLSGGGTITYKGNVSRCIWWELVGVDTGVEGTAYGALSHVQQETDVNGYATAVYTAPISIGANQSDRIRVYESQAVA